MYMHGIFATSNSNANRADQRPDLQSTLSPVRDIIMLHPSIHFGSLSSSFHSSVVTLKSLTPPNSLLFSGKEDHIVFTLPDLWQCKSKPLLSERLLLPTNLASFSFLRNLKALLQHKRQLSISKSKTSPSQPQTPPPTPSPLERCQLTSVLYRIV